MYIYIYIYINTELLDGNQGHQEETHRPTHRFRRLFLDLLSMGWRGCARLLGRLQLSNPSDLPCYNWLDAIPCIFFGWYSLSTPACCGTQYLSFLKHSISDVARPSRHLKLGYQQKASKLLITGPLCENIDGLASQRSSYAESISMLWRFPKKGLTGHNKTNRHTLFMLGRELDWITHTSHPVFTF